MENFLSEVNRVKHIMGLITESTKKNIRTLEKPKKFPIPPKKLQILINSQYPICRVRNYPCVGKISTEDCKTDLGVIGGLYSEKSIGVSDSGWSLVNRFDTNSQVFNRIWEIYSENTDNISYGDWVIKNAKKLYNGIYTQQLADIVKNTVSSGYRSERFASETIKNIWGEKVISITTHCAGDYRDRKLGQDLDVIIDGVSYYFQIKPFSPGMKLEDQIKKYNDVRGPYYEVISYNKAEKYKDENVDFIMYVLESSNNYIIFKNDKTHIATLSNPNSYSDKLPKYIIRYYEEPIRMSNDFNLETIEKQEKIYKKPIEPETDKKLDYYKKRRDFFQSMIDQLEKNPE